MTRPGFGTLLAISDASFAALKAGKDVPYETAFFDGRLGTDQNPITIKKEGEEELTIIVNERATKIRTIKATGAAGGTFWIIDNPALPMVAKYQWNYNFIVTSITDASLGGVKIIDDLKKTGVAVSHSILFDFNSANIDRAGRPVLDSVADYLKSNPKIKLEVQGHTDILGGADYNLHLSQRRAEAVCADLRAAGISADRLVAKGFGLTMAIADNAIPEGRAQNRRVVFRVL
jgi:outer membrane protein OmpA-like peptidoglycan-associated protein